MPHQGIESDPERIESEVLGLVLEVYPAQLSTNEIVRQVAGDPSSFSDCDTVEVAIRDLASVGLLHRNGEFSFASRAAVRADALSI
jgi:predicted transcriptional regulator with HTH domain